MMGVYTIDVDGFKESEKVAALLRKRGCSQVYSAMRAASPQLVVETPRGAGRQKLRQWIGESFPNLSFVVERARGDQKA